MLFAQGIKLDLQTMTEALFSLFEVSQFPLNIRQNAHRRGSAKVAISIQVLVALNTFAEKTLPLFLLVHPTQKQPKHPHPVQRSGIITEESLPGSQRRS